MEIVLKFIEIEWCSPEYQAALELRHRVLRQPLGLKLTAQELDGEHDQRHYGLWDTDELDGGKLVAVVIARPKGADAVELRQMAVDPDRTRQGFGTELLRHVESELTDHGFSEIHLNARETAIGFYETQGYEAIGDPFELISLPHRKMIKRTAR